MRNCGCSIRTSGDTLRGVAGALPVQLAAVTIGSGGVSSFGYSGTIAHAVLRHAVGESMLAALVALLVYRRHVFLWRDTPHPFVRRVIPSSDESIVFRSPAAGALHALVANHVVQGRIIFPGAGYLEMARAAGAMALHGVYFLQPLAAEASGLLVECAVSQRRRERVSLSLRAPRARQKFRLHTMFSQPPCLLTIRVPVDDYSST